MKLALNFTAASDRGLVRQNNEDSAYASPRLLVLADGMGGHAAGEVASQLMVTEFRDLDASVVAGDSGVVSPELLAETAAAGNQAIAEEVRVRPETEGMGTTLTAVSFDGVQLHWCHVGDSRGYVLRDGVLQQVTVDDTFVQSLVDKGELDPEDVSTHPQRSLILKACTGRPVEPTVWSSEARPGDRVLLCSDGLSDPVSFSTIEEALGVGDPAQAARKLIDLALRSGGPDNVTVVVADVVGLDSDDAAGGVEAAALPVDPVVAGALNAGVEDPRPDTAAGRAALIRTIEPAEQPSGRAKTGFFKRLRVWPLIISLLVVIALVVAAGWVNHASKKNFFVSVDGDRVIVEQGFKSSVVGIDLHKPFQKACLSEQKRVSVVSLEEDSRACVPFTVDALPESVRSSIEGLPESRYDDVLGQLQRLGSEALPVCVKRDSAASGSGDLNSPGKNCREVG